MLYSRLGVDQLKGLLEDGANLFCIHLQRGGVYVVMCEWAGITYYSTACILVAPPLSSTQPHGCSRVEVLKEDTFYRAQEMSSRLNIVVYRYPMLEHETWFEGRQG